MDDEEFAKELSALIKAWKVEMFPNSAEALGIHSSHETTNSMEYSSFIGERNYTITFASNRVLDEVKCLHRIAKVLQDFKAKDYVGLNKGGRYFEIDNIDSFGISFTVNADILDIVRKILLNLLRETPNVKNSIFIENIGSDEIHGRLDTPNGIKVIVHIFPTHP